MAKKIYTRLDKRYTGHGHFDYLVNRPLARTSVLYQSGQNITRYASMQLFNSWRQWCWHTWGPSKELDSWLDDVVYHDGDIEPVSHNPHWAWTKESTHDVHSRIYLRGDAELTMFLLRWA